MKLAKSTFILLVSSLFFLHCSQAKQKNQLDYFEVVNNSYNQKSSHSEISNILKDNQIELNYDSLNYASNFKFQKIEEFSALDIDCEILNHVKRVDLKNILQREAIVFKKNNPAKSLEGWKYLSNQGSLQNSNVITLVQCLAGKKTIYYAAYHKDYGYLKSFFEISEHDLQSGFSSQSKFENDSTYIFKNNLEDENVKIRILTGDYNAEVYE